MTIANGLKINAKLFSSSLKQREWALRGRRWSLKAVCRAAIILTHIYSSDDTKNGIIRVWNAHESGSDSWFNRLAGWINERLCHWAPPNRCLPDPNKVSSHSFQQDLKSPARTKSCCHSFLLSLSTKSFLNFHFLLDDNLFGDRERQTTKWDSKRETHHFQWLDRFLILSYRI